MSNLDKRCANNKPFAHPTLALMVMMCWASQSSAQPTRANTTIVQKPYATIGVCNETSTFEVMKSGAVDLKYVPSLYPESVAEELFPESKLDVDLQNSIANAPVQIIKEPKHGQIKDTVMSKDGFAHDYQYIPNAKYQGSDNAELLVNVDGKIIKIIYYFKVVDRTGNKLDKNNAYIKQYCPSPNWWKISSNPDGKSVSVGWAK